MTCLKHPHIKMYYKMNTAVILLAFTLTSIGLIAISGVLSRYAIYTLTYRTGCSYFIFLVLSVILAFAGFLLLTTIFDFFPESPLPHLNIFD